MVLVFGELAPSSTLASVAFRTPDEASTSETRRLSAFENLLAGKTNKACRAARIARLTFDSVRNYRPDTNYCELPLSQLPADVRMLLENLAVLNAKIAALLDQEIAATFSGELGITLVASYRGSAGSERQGQEVFLSVLEDWKPADFAPMIYVHEVIHFLMTNGGPASRALRGLQEHPLLIEALPDLISAAVHDSPKIRLGEAGLPECLRTIRDGSPIRTFDEPFGYFYPLASIDETNRCCQALDLDAVAPFAKSICLVGKAAKPVALEETTTLIRDHELRAIPYTRKRLAEPLQAETCRVTTKMGIVYLDNCDAHQFGPPLVSFFFRLKELTGRPLVGTFFAKIREGAEATPVYECGFANGTELLGGAKAEVSLRPLLGAFIALRESLPSADRAAFDRAWKEHGFGKVVDLDRIYRNEMLPAFAFAAVKARNKAYRSQYGCANAYTFDPVACRVTCGKKL